MDGMVGDMADYVGEPGAPQHGEAAARRQQQGRADRGALAFAAGQGHPGRSGVHEFP